MTVDEGGIIQKLITIIFVEGISPAGIMLELLTMHTILPESAPKSGNTVIAYCVLCKYVIQIRV